MALKSILKTTSPARNDTSTTIDRNHKLALHHANLLQTRKDIVSDVLTSLEILIDFPTHPTDPSQPSLDDFEQFEQLIRPFEISDYDALIEERNAAGRCGYVFCPRPRKQDDKRRQKYSRLVRRREKGKELRVLSGNRLEMWCGSICAKSAMYIKVQLNEMSAWERAASVGNRIELLEENDSNTEAALRRKMQGLALVTGDEMQLNEALADLALERGETKNSGKAALVMSALVVENTRASIAKPPDPGHDSSHLEIEGYAPQMQAMGQQDRDNEDADWDMG